MVSLNKGSVSLGKAEVYTLITAWGRKDYDLLALVIYTDGRMEWVSCFGTTQSGRFTTKTPDGCVVHVSGDQATSDSGGGDQPQEVIKIFVKPGHKIARIVPVIYSAQNSGIGSFRMYKVSTYVLKGNFDKLPANPENYEGVKVLARNASWNPFRYTFVPCTIVFGDTGTQIDASHQQYSKMMSERRPTWDVRKNKLLMNSGPTNASKPRPGY